MPLTDGLAALEGPRWLALLNGGRGSASQETDREGIPEGRSYTSAHVERGPDSEST